MEECSRERGLNPSPRPSRCSALGPPETTAWQGGRACYWHTSQGYLGGAHHLKLNPVLGACSTKEREACVGLKRLREGGHSSHWEKAGRRSW